MIPLPHDNDLTIVTEPITQAFRMVRFGGRKDIFFDVRDVLALVERTRDAQEIPEVKHMLDSMRIVILSAYKQAIEAADIDGA